MLRLLQTPQLLWLQRTAPPLQSRVARIVEGRQGGCLTAGAWAPIWHGHGFDTAPFRNGTPAQGSCATRACGAVGSMVCHKRAPTAHAAVAAGSYCSGAGSVCPSGHQLACPPGDGASQQGECRLLRRSLPGRARQRLSRPMPGFLQFLCAAAPAGDFPRNGGKIVISNDHGPPSRNGGFALSPTAIMLLN